MKKLTPALKDAAFQKFLVGLQMPDYRHVGQGHCPICRLLAKSLNGAGQKEELLRRYV